MVWSAKNFEYRNKSVAARKSSLLEGKLRQIGGQNATNRQKTVAA
jgi:hypothetical protein